jgi:hypothetical protein
MSKGSTLGQAKYSRTMSGSMPSEIAYTNIKREKKMGWLKRKFAEWSREAWETSRSVDMVDSPVRGHDSINGKTSVRFTVYPASGGFVIEHYKQDRFKDGDGPSLTIVHNGDSLGTAVEHIITMEALRS